MVVHAAVVDGQVVTEEGALSGLLNIAKCLYDVIHRLEKKKAGKAEEEEGMSDEKQELAISLLKVNLSPSCVGAFCVLHESFPCTSTSSGLATKTNLRC